MKVHLLRAAVMPALVLGLIATLAAAGWTAESTMTTDPVTSITTLKRLYPDTLIAEKGVPMAEIVIPDGEDYAGLGARVRDAIRNSTGVEVTIRKDSEFAGKYGAVKQTPSKNVIVLGNMETSNLIAFLYARRQSCEDALYPGDGGYVIRTVSDPWGNGANVIILGGSDLKGVASAVDAFCASIPKGATAKYPGALKAKFSPAFVKRFPELANDPSDTAIAEQLVAADKSFRAGVHSGLFPQITAAGYGYLRSGNPGYVKLFRDMIFLAHDLYNQDLGTYGGPWGMDADFKFMDLIATWDVVEESPVLTDEDRLKITNIILEYIRYWESYWSVKPVLTPGIRNNHTTFTSLGFMFAADYFGKYYRLPQASHWMAMADGCFQAQARSFKPQEDSNSYQWITLNHMMTYALARPDASYITSGKARIGGDLAIMTMDNLGYQVSFGDVGAFHGGNVEMHLWRPLAAVERDGRYMWAYLKGYGVRPSAGPNAYHSSVKPQEPTDLLGVKWLPTDEIFFKYYNGKGTVPQDRTFEKISFRTSFDPKKPYLLIDGISGCGHGHSDGNSVLRLTDKGRIWLGDCDYIKAQPKFHNMLMIFRDGQSFGLPAFSEREIVADLGKIAFTRTTTPGCSGTDWSRNIIWDKGSTFVFIDEVEAKVDDEFSARCYWQALGEPRLDGSAFTTTQGGPSMTIRNLDGARLRTWDDPVTGKNWTTYKFADPIIRVLQQVRTERLKAGERVFFLNVVSTQDKGKSPVPAERVSDSSILIGRSKDRALVGVRTSDEAITQEISTDAVIYRLAGDRIALGCATNLSVDGKSLFNSDRPISIEIEAGGAVVIDAEEPATVTLPVGGEVRVDGKQVKAVRIGGLARIAIPAGRHTIEGADLPDRFDISYPKPQPAKQRTVGSEHTGVAKLVRHAEFAVEAGPKSERLTADDYTISVEPDPLPENLLVPDADQRIASLSDKQTRTGQTSVMWEAGRKVVLTYRLKKPEPLCGVNVHAWWGSTSSKGFSYLVREIRVLAGESESELSPWASLTENATHPDWDAPIVYELAAEVRTASVVRIEVMPRSGSGVYLAEVELRAAVQSSASVNKHLVSLAADESGLYAGSADGKVYALSTDGTLRWDFDAGSEVKALWVGKLDKDEPNRIAVGAAESKVFLLDENGKQLWETELPYYKRIAKVVYFSTADLKGDGNRALIVGSENWHHYAFDSGGQQIWKYESVHASTAGCPIDLDGDGREEYIAGTEYYWWHGVSPTGEKLWQYRTPTGPRTTSVVAGKVGDGKPTVFFGGADGYIHSVNADGTLAWQYSTGDEITGLALSDLDGDGKPEVLAGSLSFNVVATRCDGTKLWRRDIGEPIKALVLADMDADGSDEVCVGTEDGRVIVLDRAGEPVAEWTAGSEVARLAVVAGSPDRLACITVDGVLSILQTK